jgi:hypothetical protein
MTLATSPANRYQNVHVALYATVYDNDTLIVESFLPARAQVRLIAGEALGAPADALSGETLSGEPVLDWRRQPTGTIAYEAALDPHAFRVFRLQS